MDTSHPVAPAHIDLSQLRFVEPGGIVALAVYVERLVQAGQRPLGVTAPLDSSVSNYLARARIHDYLENHAVPHNIAPVRERELGARLVPLTSFRGGIEITALASSAYEFAEQARPNAGGPLHTALCEAGENVVVHAESERGYAVAQYFPNLGRFDFAIGDAGRGYLGSLAARGATDHASATRLALTPGVSSTDDGGRGYGLSTIVEQLLDLDGAATFVTGNHQLVRFGRGHEVAATLDGLVEGTVVTGRFRA